MGDAGEQLTAEPRRLARWVLLLGVLGLVTLLATLLLNRREPPPCVRPAGPATARPVAAPISPADPLVRDLHFRAVDHARTAKDRPPSDLLPVDMRSSARRLGEFGQVTVFLAPGAGFTCLAADAGTALDASIDQTPSVCLLNSVVANHGLTVTLRLEGDDEPVVVVAVPDGMDLVTRPSTEHLTDGPNLAVLRPVADPVEQQAPGHPPVVVHARPVYADEPGSC